MDFGQWNVGTSLGTVLVRTPDQDEGGSGLEFNDLKSRASFTLERAQKQEFKSDWIVCVKN